LAGIFPRQHAQVAAGLRGLSSVDQKQFYRFLGGDLSEVIQVAGEILRDGLSGFNFNRLQAGGKKCCDPVKIYSPASPR